MDAKALTVEIREEMNHLLVVRGNVDTLEVMSAYVRYRVSIRSDISRIYGRADVPRRAKSAFSLRTPQFRVFQHSLSPRLSSIFATSP